MIFLFIIMSQRVHFFSATTYAITVQVRSAFQEELSSHEQMRYSWTYHITIENQAAFSVQLLRRHWLIVDNIGHAKHVHGEGVVGKQPIIRPKEAFEYSSQVNLRSISGVMSGTYEVRKLPSDELLRIAVPPFSLDIPGVLMAAH